MVNIAIAGGSGHVAQEVIDQLLARKSHQITILSRKPPPSPSCPGVRWARTDYRDKARLGRILRGVDTVLSFIVVAEDACDIAQRTLIDACVAAGVRRFAPSEWAGTADLPWYAGKARVRAYLEDLNKKSKVLEYCCFRPGLFTNYLGWPVQTAKHMRFWQTHLDFMNKRVIIMEDEDDNHGHPPPHLSFTTIQDLAAVVAHAVEFPGEWPTNGGICGSRVSIPELLEIGQRCTGAATPISIERIRRVDAEAEILMTSWVPSIEHSMIPVHLREKAARVFTAKTIVSMYDDAWDVSDEWNQLLPNYEFTQLESFLPHVWAEREERPEERLVEKDVC